MTTAFTWRFCRASFSRQKTVPDVGVPGHVGFDSLFAESSGDGAGGFLALRVLENFPKFFSVIQKEAVSSSGDVVIELSIPPSLDCMLAAEIMSRGMRGDNEFPAGLRRMAEYAGMAVPSTPIPGEGDPCLSPGGLLSGILSSLRGSLDNPDVALGFLAQWELLADLVWRNAETGLDPFAFPLVGANEALPDVVGMLREDLDLFRADATAGATFRATRLEASREWLLLTHPKSRLYKEWAFSPAPEAGGGARDVLAVCWPPGDWLFYGNVAIGVELSGLVTAVNEVECENCLGTEGWSHFFRDGEAMVSSPPAGSVIAPGKIWDAAADWGKLTERRLPGAMASSPSLSFPASGMKRFSGSFVRKATVFSVIVAFLVTSYAFFRTGRHQPDLVPDREADRGLVLLKDDSADTGIASLGRTWLLCIAIDTYARTDIWCNLGAEPGSGPTHDAQRLIEILREKYRGFGESDDSEVVTLFNEQATRSGITKALLGLKDSLRENDVLLVFYAGHGYAEPALNRTGSRAADDFRGFWIPHDGGGRDEGRSQWYAYEELVRDIDTLPARHVLLISDSCYAGDLLTSFLYRSAEPVVEPPYIQKAMRHRSRQVLTAGGRERVPNRSEFMDSLVDALARNEKTFITPGELFAMIAPEIKATTPRVGVLPGKYHEVDGQFFFVKRNDE